MRRHGATQRRWLRIGAIAGAAAIGLGSIGLWLLSRESTFIAAVNYVVRHMDGRLQVVEPHGSLLSAIRVRELKYRDEFGTVAIQNAQMRWRPMRLLVGQVAVGAMTAESVAVHLAETQEQQRKPPQSLRAPMSFAVTDFRVTKLSIYKAGATQEIRDLRAAFSGDSKRLTGEVKSLDTQWGHVRAEVKVGANHPFDVKGSVALSSLQENAYALKVGLGGSLMNAAAP